MVEDEAIYKPDIAYSMFVWYYFFSAVNAAAATAVVWMMIEIAVLETTFDFANAFRIHKTPNEYCNETVLIFNLSRLA